MSDYGDFCRDMRDNRREVRSRLGVDCPTCTINLPKANPSKLLPQQRCRVCGYVDPRPYKGGKR